MYRVTRLEGVDATITVPDGWQNVQSYGVGRKLTVLNPSPRW